MLLFAGSLAVAGVIGVFQIAQLRRQTAQQQRQSELDSAHLVIKLKEPLRTREFRDCPELINHGSVFDDESQSIALDRFLYHVDTICAFSINDLITERHMVEHYDGLLVTLVRNRFVGFYLDNEKDGAFPHIAEHLTQIAQYHS